MFAWLTRFRWRNRRQIFCYWDGQSYRYIDPMVAYRGLVEDPEYLMDRTPLQLNAAIELGKEEDALDLMRIMATACRRVFDVQPINPQTGEGLADSECVTLMTAFGLYLSALKKNISTPPTSPQSTEIPADSATSNSSDSSSIATDSTIDAAQKSPSASGPLSDINSPSATSKP